MQEEVKWSRLVFRTLLYYWRTNLAVMAGVATAVAVLSGALLVGQSVRSSLRNLLYQRIGAAEYVISADRFFREDLAGELDLSGEPDISASSCPLIYLEGLVVHEESGLRALNVNVYGIDERFWKFHQVTGRQAPEDRDAFLGASLAGKLGAKAGDGLLLRVETQQGIPRELLFGHRENVGRTVRLVCKDILSADKLGEFSLRPDQGNVYSIFVPLTRLQRDLAQPLRANAILLNLQSRDDKIASIRNSLKSAATLEDLGIKLRALPSLGVLSLESSRIILDDSLAEVVLAAAADEDMKASGVFTYLANSLRAGGREIPYSVITAVDFQQGAFTSVNIIEGAIQQPASSGQNGAIWLNDWAWRDLGIALGEAVEVDYYLWQEDGRLVTQTAHLQLAGVVSISGDVDASLAPDYPGITGVKSIADWDPPFPMDLNRVRPKDEDYWDIYRSTPKAFVTLAKGQELWQSRYGKLSAIRIAPPQDVDLKAAREKLVESLRRRLNPERAGLSISAVKELGLNASQGSTDFGEYFVYFSFFLIAAAVLLSALFFRLGIEQRVREVGALQAMGFPRSSLYRIFLLEGSILSIGGSLLGLLGAVAYGWFLVFGLRTWWLGAVGTQQLFLHVSWIELSIGAVTGIIASLGTIFWTLRALRKISPRALLAGVLESFSLHRHRVLSLKIISSCAFLAAALLLLGSTFGKISEVTGFFGAGFLLLVSILSMTALFMRRANPNPIVGYGLAAFLRLAVRNTIHRPGRSLLCVALIASATFIIVSVEAFHQDEHNISLETTSGTGGYPLIASSALPIVLDPNSTVGREALGIIDSSVPAFDQVTFIPFRVRPGDDASCLNLYAPQEPRILGVSPTFTADARFSFRDSLASTAEEEKNPWLLLESQPLDGIIPAIADANTIQYILHLAVGDELIVHRGNGEPVHLQLVAALRDSIFQGELLISEANFLRAFPEQEGFRFFLLDVPAEKSASLIPLMEERLADWGFAVESSRERLAAYHQVENTYLSTFQSLGILGLVLGTVGLATILLRNVLERRKELALLRAVGYDQRILSGIIVTENLVLVIWGLVCGGICALLSILPALQARGVAFPVLMISLILFIVLIVGLASSILAVLAALRTPLLDALRSE